ncbi:MULTISPECIES: hypothetical protein [Bizionia]|uniref:Lipoprotein n=1 Tax=Bizionia algoritergicola TaxID=291187 RepID=A0A5D0R1R6_9FLAO|nr:MULTISPECIES: hypothetical protein [Bizionia]OBX21883.1 hypothetical protein BAA08_11080 [Bizionia sp. APA-3]TYB75019.1 hypothetical protein ES675_02475 [Bizionia algoritergicola]
MKKLFVCLFALASLACSVNDEDIQSSTVMMLPVESAIVPNEFVSGQEYEIFITYKRPTECHVFKDIYSQTQSDGLMIAIMSTVFNENNDCPPSSETVEKSFKFKPSRDENTYVFKFWHGSNGSGEDEFIIFEVPVVD